MLTVLQPEVKLLIAKFAGGLVPVRLRADQPFSLVTKAQKEADSRSQMKGSSAHLRLLDWKMARSLAERLHAHEQQKARLAEQEAKLKDAGHKARIRRLIEVGSLVEKAGLLDLDSNALYGTAVAPRQGRRRYTSLVFLQDTDDLLFREPRSLHRKRSFFCA
jgi:Conjugal transfer protein TraD